MIQKALVKDGEKPQHFKRTVIAIDPAVSSNKQSNETGIIVASIGEDDKYYIREDLSGRYSPDAWARVAVENYYKYEADKIIAEVNNGGDLVEKVVRTIDMNFSYRSVRATKGKYLRAEPVSAHMNKELNMRNRFLFWKIKCVIIILSVLVVLLTD